MKPLTRKQRDTRISELICECDRTANAKNAIEEEAKEIQKNLEVLLRDARRSELAALKKCMALQRVVRVYIDVDLGDA